MGTTPAAKPHRSSTNPAAKPVVNDFTIHVATVNGSGSQSSNMVLMRSLFQMGLPVSGKNLFPSNIQGLPTWFTIRANKAGYLGRRVEVDLMVCMNPQTARADVQALHAGATCIYDAPLNLKGLRSDVRFLEIPFAKLINEIPDLDNRLKKLLANMCYVGAVAQLAGIETKEIEAALNKQFKKKPKAVALNMKAAELGAAYVREHYGDPAPFRAERMNATAGKIIIEGNAASAIGALMAGCSVLAWYPITPSSSLCETLISLAKKYRTDPQTGKSAFAAIQAEDELASIGMVLGAGWAGARSMTATSGPGISLMAEFAGFGYYAEVPAVIVDVQRTGPSTGLPTRTQQADLLEVAYLSHGDTQHIALIPGTVHECYAHVMAAFDLAERFQTPVFVLSDLDLGMNSWMADPLPYPKGDFDRGKVLDAKAVAELKKAGKRFERYRDADGDGIPYRTVPGNENSEGTYFTRGSGHDEAARYTEDHEAYVRVMDRLARKYETARTHVPAPEPTGDAKAEIGLLLYGSAEACRQEALDKLAAAGIKAAALRVKALPFHPDVAAFVKAKKRVYVLDLNRDAQMLKLLKADLPVELLAKLRSIRHYDGLPVHAQTVCDQIAALEKEGK
ncbi:MAG: 2-oxoacid:acceptor oxidoreductase subunit alpha [Planctomycetes bacterium]|nr:2-oxoacid:acceptor oxidoreductase subunit alpha [Planctomycetota bacterium]